MCSQLGTCICGCVHESCDTGGEEAEGEAEGEDEEEEEEEEEEREAIRSDRD
jgi:hypothetical protein